MSIVAELKRRNVFKVAAAYLVAGWLLIEASSVMMEAFDAPAWLPKIIAALLAAGFPLAMFFAWAFEVTPEGIKRESEVDRSASITHVTSQRLNIVTVVLLVLAIGLFVTEDLWRANNGVVPSAADASDSELVSIAVMPFDNMSADSANEYFADGIAEEILNLLAGVKTMSVASRTSAFAFKGSAASITDIASSLGVRYVLEGSVRKAGDQVRITAQLIDAGNDRHLWSETFDRTLDDIFSIQDEIAAAIGKALRVELLGEGGQRVNAESIDPDAYARFLEARHLLRRRNAEDVAAALESLIEVVQVEQRFARGHVMLAEALVINALNENSRATDARTDRSVLRIAMAQAKYHALVAADINPELSGVYLVLGSVKEDASDRVGAIADYERATALEPNEPRPYQWRSITLVEAGYIGRAKSDSVVAMRLDPDNANIHGNLGVIHQVQGDMAAAESSFERQIALGNTGTGRLALLLLALFNNGIAAAESHFPAATRQRSEEERNFLATAIAAAKDPARRDELLVLADRLRQDNMGIVLQTLQSLRLKEGLLQQYASSDFGWIDGPSRLVWHADFADVRADPRFIDFMERLGFVDLWRELGPPADCRPDGDSFRCGYGFD